MRIVGGSFSGRALVSVGSGDEKGRLRPTSDRVRESLFNVLEHGNYPDFEAARVLDLFAGTGALGLEALSRGASHVTFVEKGRVGRGIIRGNIKQLGCADQCSVLSKDATRLGANTNAAYDICFLDPPYGAGLGERALSGALRQDWFHQDTLIVLEEGQQIALPPDFKLLDVRKYGDTHIHLATLKAVAEP